MKAPVISSTFDADKIAAAMIAQDHEALYRVERRRLPRIASRPLNPNVITSFEQARNLQRRAEFYARRCRKKPALLQLITLPEAEV